MTYYSRKIEMPKTRKEGLCNFVQMIINEAEAGNTREALLKAVDLLNDLQGNYSPYQSVINEDKTQFQTVLDEMKRQHSVELAKAIETAKSEGFAEGITAARRDIASKLGLL